MNTVGFIGLGNMGSGVAGNIHKAGYPLVVYDTRPEAMRPFLVREARPARSPAEVAQLSDMVLTSLWMTPFLPSWRSHFICCSTQP